MNSRPVTADCLMIVKLDADDATLATFHFTKLDDITGHVQVRNCHVGTQSHVHHRTTNNLQITKLCY